MSKRLLLALGLLMFFMVSFTGGLAISKYRQSAATTINYTLTEYNEDGKISDSSKIVRICNRHGEWSETQIFANGKLRTSQGKVTPREDSLDSFPDLPRKEILGRTVVVMFDRKTEAWYDPSLHDFLKNILYTDETRQTVRAVVEAVEIKN
ncbi:MAG: hypothetical protein M3R68_11290 [Acidobacteriota bacterium]|nr:hypothetical protein [Acidobacteriota bacterium]